MILDDFHFHLYIIAKNNWAINKKNPTMKALNNNTCPSFGGRVPTANDWKAVRARLGCPNNEEQATDNKEFSSGNINPINIPSISSSGSGHSLMTSGSGQSLMNSRPRKSTSQYQKKIKSMQKYPWLFWLKNQLTRNVLGD